MCTVVTSKSETEQAHGRHEHTATHRKLSWLHDLKFSKIFPFVI